MIDLTNRWVVLAFLFVIGLTAPFQFQAVAALAPYLIAEGRLTYTDVGLFTGLFMLPGIVLAAFSGMLSARIGDRMTLVLGIALMTVSAVVFALSDNYWIMLACRVVSGAGGVAVTVLLPKMVADWFEGREIATAMATIAASVGVGIGGAMAALPMIAEKSSWQVAIFATAALCIGAIVLLLVVYRDAKPPATGPAGSPLLWHIDRQELILCVLAGVGRGLFSAGYAVFMGFTPALLIAQGMSPVDAGLWTSISAIASLISVPLGGYLSDRTRKPNYFIVGGSIGAFLSCLMLPILAPALLWIILFGLLRGGCTGGLMSLPTRILRPESRSTGFALLSAVTFVCMFAFPAIAGYLLDLTGNPAAPIWFAAVLWISISLLLTVFLILEKRWIAPRRRDPKHASPVK